MSFRSVIKEAARHRWRRFLPLCLMDLAFFIIFALLHTLIVLQALPDLSAINQLVAEESKNVPEVPTAESFDPSKLQFDFPLASFQERYTHVLRYAALYLAAMFILYNLAFAFTWLRTSVILKKRPMPYLAYLKRFAAVNAVWILFYLLGFYALILTTTATMFGQVTVVSQGVVDAIGLVLAVLLLYFAMVSHALLIDHKVLPLLKRTFMVGVKEIAHVGSAFLLVGIAYYLPTRLIMAVGPSSPGIASVLFLLLFVPWVTASRLFFMVAVQQAAKK